MDSSQFQLPAPDTHDSADGNHTRRSAGGSSTSAMTYSARPAAAAPGRSGLSSISLKKKPFDRLPLELISEIFISYTDPLEHCWRDVRKLARVSKKWRDIVLSTPQLWVFVASTDMFEPQFRLSKNLPLDIQIRGRNGGFRHLANIQPLLVRSKRWRSLEIAHDSRFITEAQPTLKDPLPCLERLKLEHEYDWRPINHLGNSSPWLISVTLGEAPRLRDLCLQDVFIRPPYTHQFHALKTLSFRSREGLITMRNMYDILALLSTCPALEHLTLNACGSPSPENDVAAEAEAVSGSFLSNLKKLVLDGLHSGLVDVLLRCASMKNLTYFTYHGGGETPIQSIQHHLADAVLPILAWNRDREVVLQISGTTVKLTVEDCISIGCTNATSAVEEARLLGTGLQLHNADVSLALSGHLTELFASISLLPPQVLNIRTIYIYLIYGADLKKVLQIIAPPGIPKLSLPFAALEQIVIVGRAYECLKPSFPDDIKAFLQARERAAAAYPDLEARPIVVKWNEDMVYNEQAGAFEWD